MEKKEEIDINEPKVFTKKSSTKKPATKKKPVLKEIPPVEEIREVYQYKGEGELIMDKPSQPMILVQKQFSDKDAFEKLAREGRGFTLKIGGSLIYDSDGKISKTFSDISFEEDGFMLYGKKFSYDGLNFKFKR